MPLGGTDASDRTGGHPVLFLFWGRGNLILLDLCQRNAQNYFFAPVPSGRRLPERKQHLPLLARLIADVERFPDVQALNKK